MTMTFTRTEKVTAAEKLTEETVLTDFLGEVLVKKNEAENAERYKDRPKSLGAGRVGHPKSSVYWDRGCERALYYETKQYPSENPFPDFLYRIFTMGHQAENIVVENLRAAGFTVLTHDAQGNQYGFAIAHDPETGHPRFKGFIDGVVVAGPEVITMNGETIHLKYPFLWENKAINDKKFDKFREVGVEKSHPNYYGQIQIYMNFLNLYQSPALLTVLNRNTGRLGVEFVRFNQSHCQAGIDRAARVIEAKNPLTLERPTQDYEKIPCKWCDYRKQCKADEEARAQSTINPDQAAPAWLSQQ